MTQPDIETMVVEDLLARWPDAARVFHRRRMACPGCAMAPFMTVAEACASYGTDPAAVLAELRAIVAAGGAAPGA